MAATKTLITVLKLDGAKFKSDLSDVQKTALAVSAASTAVSAALVGATALAVKATADYQDATIKAARASGMAVQEYSSLAHAAKLSGLNVETLAASMKKVLKPSEETVKNLAGFGVALKDTSGKMLSQQQILDNVGKKYKSLENPADRARLAMTAFGEEGTKMASLLESDFGAMAEQARLMGRVVTEEAGRAAEQFNDSIAVLTGSMEGLRDQVASSIIQFVNQSGIVDHVAKSVQGITQAWLDLSPRTQENIIMFAAMAVGLTGVIGGMAAIVAIAPVVGAAVTAAMGPVGITITAVAVAAAGLAAAFVLLRDTTAEDAQAAKQAETEIASLGKRYEELANQAKTSASAQGEIRNVAVEVGRMEKQLGITVDATNRSLKDRIALIESTAHAQKTAALVELTSRKLVMEQEIKNLEAMNTSGRQSGRQFALNSDRITSLRVDLVFLGLQINQLRGDYDIATDSVNRHTGALGRNASEAERAAAAAAKLAEEAEKSARARVKAAHEAFAKEHPAIVQLEAATQDWITAVNQIPGAFRHSLAAGALAVANLAGKIADSASVAIEAWAKVSEQLVAGMRRAQEKQGRQMQEFTRLYSMEMDRQVSVFRGAEEQRLKALEESEAALLAKIRSAEQQKLDLLMLFQSERRLANDAEYQAARDKAEQEHRAFVDSERVRFEERMAQLDEFNLTEEEKRATRAAMEENWLAYQQELQADHETTLADLAKQHADKTKGIDDELKIQLKLAQEQSKESIEAEEYASNQRLEAEKARSDDEISRMEQEKANREKQMANFQAFTKWRGDVAVLQATKGVQTAQTIAAGIAGAAQAFAALAPIPFIGPVLGAAAAAAILTASGMAARQIQMQTIPPPPIQLAQGGAISRSIMGGPAAGDVVPAMLTPGESVRDVETTRRIRAFESDALGGGKKQIHVVIYNTNQGLGEIREDQLDRLGDALAYRVAREVQVR